MDDGSNEDRSVPGPVDEHRSTEAEGLRQETSGPDHDESWVLQRNDEVWFSTTSIASDQERSLKESLIREMVDRGLDQPMVNLRSIEYDESLIEPYTDSDVWVGQHTVILKDAWNDAWRRYEERFDTSYQDLLKKIRQYDEVSQAQYSLPRGHVQYFTTGHRSGRRQFISRYEEWMHYHQEIDLQSLSDPDYIRELKETILERLPKEDDIPPWSRYRRDGGLWSDWDDSNHFQSCYWNDKYPVHFSHRVSGSSLGVIGGD